STPEQYSSADHLGGAVSEQLVEVHLRLGEYLVLVFSSTPTGPSVLDGVATRLPENTPAEQLGVAVDAALSRSGARDYDPTRDDAWARRLLALLHPPAFATSARGTRSVEVSRNSGTVVVQPQHNEGKTNGYTPIDHEARVFPPNCSARQLGEAVVDAFER